MLKLYHNPMTRSLRILWLLEELGLDYRLIPVEFVPPVDGKIFSQKTPTGRFPTLEDEETSLCESGVIAQYLIERYGEGHLAPSINSSLRAKYLQWTHFPEGTINPYLNAIQRFSKSMPTVVNTMKEELDIALAFASDELANQPYIVGEKFTGADIMLAVSLLSANMLGLIADKHSNILSYFNRLQSRDALIKALQS
ncbi:Glutathione S-transferase, N-terminal domain protein [Synechococcus sp. PCC 7335]|uniref:glutathione S-transferase family protein n=1 Tax=Synechococcus sp. (strain ATCC 29403 / PCC 7335) TaxID=91464 RepID=UPI00017EB195|nr:glutathione S-transferase family protein [Synechococcus sp. PCC 7335]EDX83589.1 Glutathione S-transferase, N-terminal domain protein [Synechococcus sp. PCC 7335]